MQLLEGGWDYTFQQNASNSVLWNLSATATDECPDCPDPGIQYIETNGGSFSGIFTTSFQANAQLLFGMAPASAIFLNSGSVQQTPSGLVVPVGWQSGPLQVNLQPTQTNGLLMLSWTGADGSIFIQHKISLADTNWQVLAGPVSGGAYSIAIPTNTGSGFFRLEFGPLTNAIPLPPLSEGP